MNFKPNTLFACHALEVLEHLPSNKVRLIYLDPSWITRGTEEASVNAAAIYFAKIVQQFQRILDASGSLFVHCQSDSPLDARLIANQAFGAQPLYEIAWHFPNRRQDLRLKVDHDDILVYADEAKAISNPVYRPLSDKEASNYLAQDERGAVPE